MSYTGTVTLTTLTCSECGIVFGLPHWYEQTRREDHKTFYCPNRHDQYFPHKSDAEIERDKRIRAEAKAARMEDKAEVAERRRRAEKAAKTRVLNRVKNGVCPHCNRTFQDLARHMETKHHA